MAVILFVAVTVGSAWAFAAPQGTGLPLPRFVSLRADEVNMRAGPGTQYPVEWVYRRLGLPVEIVAEYRTWRQVRDVDGTLGWIHRSMLDATRTIIVTGELQTLRRQPDPTAPAVAVAEAGVIGRLVECPAHLDWCQVEAGGVDGWLPHTALWGLLAGETLE